MLARLLGACPPSLSHEQENQMESIMKRMNSHEFASNLLIIGSVSLAFTPFVLGDRLIMIVTGLMKEGGVMIDQFSNYVSWLVS